MTQPFHLCPDLDELHANERLNYVLGQVLGVKDFQQEQLYFLHKARLHNRSLHGYGTVWGLDVTTQGTGDDLEIQVDCGLAIDPQGREVRVDALQCAPLNTWLAAAVAEGEETANRDTLVRVVRGRGRVGPEGHAVGPLARGLLLRARTRAGALRRARRSRRRPHPFASSA